MSTRPIYVGTDCGATTSKIVALWEDGTPVSTKLLQRTTRSADGPEATVRGWVDAVEEYLKTHNLSWDQVKAAGLATPGPYQKLGVLDKTANLPPSFWGFDVLTAYHQAWKAKTGRDIPVSMGNDGNLGGVAEAAKVRGNTKDTVVMLAPGSGLGAAYVGADGLPLDGDTLNGMEAGHMPAPIHELNIPPLPCGCGRTWGCIESYTTIAGLNWLLQMKLKDYPGHPLANSPKGGKDRALDLRGLAQKGDALALELFDFQAKALGHFVAILAMALDPTWIVVAGGLMDPESTTPEFRKRYLDRVRDTAMPNLWTMQKNKMKIVEASLGELSQAIGAGLVALYQSKK
ncbi:MAG: ROK family protein [Tepidisphaeraceae bacterium]